MPTTTTGVATEFINFTRASNATVTDSNGLIDWAAHNLIQASEQFDAASWNNNLVTVSANSVAAPNGTTTADRIVEQASSGLHFARQSITLPAARHVVGIFAKAAERSRMLIYNFTFSGGASFNLSSGTVIGNIDAAPVASSITSVGNGWHYCTVTFDCPAGSNDIRFYLGDDAGLFNYAGDATKGFLLWGAHLYRSDLGGMQANTSAYPMYNPTTPKNLLGFTENFDNAGWTKANIAAFGSGSIANAVVAPNGLQTADKIVATAVSGYHGVRQAFTYGTGTYTISVYAKAAEYTKLYISDLSLGNGFAAYDLVSGTVISSGGSPKLVSANIEAAPNGFFRCSLVVTNVNASSTPTFVGYPTGATLDSNGASYTGDGTSGIYLWGAQLSDSASLDPYSPNHFTAPSAAAYYGPRRDFDSAGVCRGLLIEEQRSNVVLNSAAFGSWSDNGATVAANTVVSPDGTMTADELTRASATSDSRFQTVTFTGDGTKSVSIYVKYNTAPTFAVFLYDSTAVANRMLIDFAFTAGVPASSSVNSGSVEAIENVGGGWYRIKLLCPSVVAANTNVLYVYPARTGSSNGQKTTFWGAQAENGSFATSYIPTTTATATRNADVAQVGTAAFPYSATEGTLVANFSYLGGSAVNSSNQFAVSLRETSNSAILIYNGGGVAAGYCLISGVDQAYLPRSAVSANVTTKLGFAFKANDFAAVQDGGAAATDPSGTLPSPTVMAIGSSGLNTAYANGHIRQITYLPRRISNTELQTRTA